MSPRYIQINYQQQIENGLLLVQNSVGFICALDVVTDAMEEHTTVRVIKGNLADNLIEALTKEFFTDGAEAGLTSLSLQQFLVQHLTKTCYIDSRGGLMAHLLHEVFALLYPFSGWQEIVEYVLGTEWSLWVVHRS